MVERLAKLLYLGETPTVHVPSPEDRAWRELINCRSQVTAKRTRAKNSVRALLRSAGVVPLKQPGLWAKRGLAWLRQVPLPTASQQSRRDLLLEEIETLIRQIQRIEQQLNHQAHCSPAVTCLRTIPGVGVRTAEAAAVFIDDPLRFPHSNSVGRYFGLDPLKTSQARRNGSGTSHGKRHRWSGNWSLRRPGKPYADHRRFAPSSSEPSEVIRSERRSRWWLPPITSYA
jgi:transposase